VTELIVETANREDAMIVSLIGAGDLSGSQVLDRRILGLLAQRPTRVILDLGGLTFISSIFMGSLIRFRQTIGHAKGKVVICSACTSVHDALTRARLDQVFEIYPAQDEAVRAICVSIS
jgi:anti-anti-sigma factor